MKILLAQFGNETNSFAIGKTTFETLVPKGWVKAEDVISQFKGTATYLGGALRAIEEEGAEPLPVDLATRGGNFGAGPVMAKECASYVMDHITNDVKKHMGDFAGVFFAVHGGGCSEIDLDLERYSFKRMRDVIGDLPMVSSLDAHANLSHDMVTLSDGLYGIKTIPHVDCEEAGYRAAKTLIRHIRGELNPKMCLKRLPLLIPATTGRTVSGPGKEIMEFAAECVKKYNLIDATFFFGFSAADCPCSSCSVLVVADGYVPTKEAEEIADFAWQRRYDFSEPSLSVEEAMDVALSKVKDGYVVINEASDNPGGGATGDGTHLLREMIKRNIKGTIMGPLTDGAAVKYLFDNHKVGDVVDIEIGGKLDPVNGGPVRLEHAEIINFSNGKLISAAPINFGAPMDYGNTVRLRQENVEVIIVTDRFQTYDDRPFIMTGCDMSQYKIIGLKSMNHFRGYFGSRADAIVTADPPGQCPINLKLYQYKNIERPILPLEEVHSI
ncbi:MAG: M81 family metallopeptidase [Clostridia bacterium]|nr:M81 family metallopeptidase [Clostridia bacterium]